MRSATSSYCKLCANTLKKGVQILVITWFYIFRARSSYKSDKPAKKRHLTSAMKKKKRLAFANNIFIGLWKTGKKYYSLTIPLFCRFKDQDDGVVVRASTLQSVDLGWVHFLSRIISKDFKKWYSELPCLTLSKIGIAWTTSQQACLMRPWARRLMGCLHLYVADRWWGKAVYPLW